MAQTKEIKETIRFNYMYGPGVEKTGQDLSRTKEDVFEELPPFAMDADGKFLNKSSFPKLVKTGQVDVQERIQSFAQDVDIYHILERMTMAGESLPAPLADGSIYDYSMIPDNIHDFQAYIDSSIGELAKLSPELAKAILNPDSTGSQLQAALNSYVDSVNAANEKKVEVKE